jgi:hypothetical protein
MTTAIAVPSVEAIQPRTQARFWAKVEKGGAGCWTWTGAATSKGYGCFGFRGKVYLAHRIMVVLSGRDLPEDMTVDHTCSNTLCVNPAHLDVVSAAENIRRYAAALVNCKRGHALSGDNLRIDRRGKRVCRECKRARERPPC